MDLELAGKTAIVTGGSRGIGKAIAREFALEGVDVAIIARDQARLDAAAKEISQESGRRVLPISADVGVDESVRGAIAQVAQTFGRIDILVNNATAFFPAEGPPPRLGDVSDETFWPEMRVKAFGFLLCAREVAPHMKEQGWGRIINVGGLASRVTGQILTSIRNAAVPAMTKNMAAELGRHGIAVTAVLPGITRTERMDEVLAGRAGSFGITVEEAERRMVEEGPFRNFARRAIEAREVAYVVVFLASPKSVAINGDSIPTGGGVGQAIYY